MCGSLQRDRPEVDPESSSRASLDLIHTQCRGSDAGGPETLTVCVCCLDLVCGGKSPHRDKYTGVCVGEEVGSCMLGNEGV